MVPPKRWTINLGVLRLVGSEEWRLVGRGPVRPVIETEVFICSTGCGATSRGPVQKPDLDEVWLIEFFYGVFFFAYGGRKRTEPDGSTSELVDDRHQQLSVNLIQTVGVYFHSIERISRHFLRDMAVIDHLGDVADPSQQTVRNSGSSARPPRDLVSSGSVDLRFQYVGRTGHDYLQILDRIEIEVQWYAESASQRGADQPGSSRRPNQREFWKLQFDRPRRRALPDDDIELVVFHRRVKYFLDGRTESMYFVDEQNVALGQIGQERREVARLLNDGSGCSLDLAPHLVRDNVREGRLAKTRRAVEQNVIQRLASVPSGLNEDRKVLFRFLLAYVFAQPLGAQTQLELLLLRARGAP